MFHLGIDTPESLEHPVHDFETLEDVEAAVRHALSKNHIWFEQECILLQTGPGSVFRIVSDEALADDQREARLEGYVVVAQVRKAQLLPFIFPDEKTARNAIARARVEGDFMYCALEGHDYTYVHMGPGVVLLGMTAESYIERQRLVLEERLRRQRAAEGEGTVARNQPPKKIILTGGN
jgi:hypothetical protein